MDQMVGGNGCRATHPGAGRHRVADGVGRTGADVGADAGANGQREPAVVADAAPFPPMGLSGFVPSLKT